MSTKKPGKRFHFIWFLSAVVCLGMGVWTPGCGPSSKNDELDSSISNHNLNTGQDADVEDGSTDDGSLDPDASSSCSEDVQGRTGVTVFVLDGLGEDSSDPIVVGTVVTVSIRIAMDQPPQAGVGVLMIQDRNLSLDLGSFMLDGSPLQVPDPFNGRIPLTLATLDQEVTFEATVQSQLATIEVEADLRYGPAAICPVPQSGSLAVLQVLGGVEKGVYCYDLDQARSVQVGPKVPLQSTNAYMTANGNWDQVVIDELVVGGNDCPGPGVMVHQISKCFTRSTASTITLSGDAYGGVPWFVDDLLMVEVLDSDQQVTAAYTTFQIGDQVLGCCFNPQCTSEVSYVQGGPLVTILNEVQGGGNNGSIAAGAFDLTLYLPQDGSEFYLRLTALDQGVEGALDRVFLNVDHP